MTLPNAEGDPLGASRLILGNVLTVNTEPELAQTRKLYLERYANSKCWVDCEDFSIYRMEVVGSYYVGAFGVMGRVAAPEYSAAQPERWLTP